MNIKELEKRIKAAKKQLKQCRNLFHNGMEQFGDIEFPSGHMAIYRAVSEDSLLFVFGTEIEEE